MGANIYVIFKNGKPVHATDGDLAEAKARTSGTDWGQAPPVLDAGWGSRDVSGDGVWEIRRVAPLPEPSPRADIYATPGTGTYDLPGRVLDRISEGIDKGIRSRRPGAEARPFTKADLQEAIRKCSALRTTSPLPQIRTDSEETFRRYVEASGVEMIADSELPAAGSFMGIPVVTDPRMLPNTIQIGDRIIVVSANGPVMEVDVSAGAGLTTRRD